MQKEVLVYVLVYNLVRSVMVTAARRQRTCPRRISFIDAVTDRLAGALVTAAQAIASSS